MWASGHRVDVWRKTKSYRLYAKVSEGFKGVLIRRIGRKRVRSGR